MPSEDPKALLAELDTIIDQLTDLICRINITNSITKNENGETLTELIAKRDMMLKKTGLLNDFLDEASSVVNRHSSSEIKINSTVNVRELRKTVDSASESIRRIDTSIQEKNWTTELI